MKTVLVDSSVWIDYLRGAKSGQTNRLDALLLDEQVVICPVILQEVLQGISNEKEYQMTFDRLQSLYRLQANEYLAAEGAAQIYRRLRRKGITIRKSNDCLIAWYAIENQIPILHKDRDFDKMARPLNIELL